jgi:hypothetical protein
MHRILFLVFFMTVLLPPVISQTKIYINISSYGQFIVTSPEGKRTGLEPRQNTPSTQWRVLQEIPDGTYDQQWNGGPPIFAFEAEDQTPNLDGTYTIDLIGDSTGFAWLGVEVLSLRDSAKVQQPYFNFENIPLQKDSVATYIFTYHCAIGSPVSLTKIVTAQSLVRDVFAMLRLKWIKTGSIATKYLHLIGDYTRQLRTNGHEAARICLRTILTNIAADSGTTLSKEACASLRPDVETLLQQ